MTTQTILAPGIRVRCEYREHHEGTVLSIEDPRAWIQTLRFPCDEPDPVQVKEHVQDLIRLGRRIDDRIPVLWDFGRAYFDDKAKLYPI
jgi:hypothetical protein